MLDEVEERLPRPLEVVEHAHERLLGRDFLEQLAEGPRDLVRGACRLRRPQERVDRRRSSGLRRPRSELLHHLDDGRVRDSLAVVEAATRDDGRIEGAKELAR